MDSGGLTGTIVVGQIISNPPGQSPYLPVAAYGRLLYFEVDWSNATAGGGQSFSRYFTVALEVQVDSLSKNVNFTSPSPAMSQSLPSVVDGGGNVPMGTFTPTAAATA